MGNRPREPEFTLSSFWRSNNQDNTTEGSLPARHPTGCQLSLTELLVGVLDTAYELIYESVLVVTTGWVPPLPKQADELQPLGG